MSGTNTFLICAFGTEDFSGGVYPPSATSRTISFFYFQEFLVLIWFYFSMRRRTVQPKFDRLFRCFNPLSRHLTEVKRSRRVRIFGRLRTVSNSATFLAKESVNSALFARGETEVQIFGKESTKFFPNFSVLARKSANFFANFSATKVTSLPSISLSLSLCISLSLFLSPHAPHAQYRTHFL